MFDYNALISKLHQLKPPMTGGLMKTVAPLTFDDGALAIRKELERKAPRASAVRKHQPETGGAYRQVQRHLCPALRGLALRRARRRRQLPPVITEDTARRVAGFLHGFLLPHALAFYAGVLGLSNDHDRLADVAGYILARKLERITNRDVQRGGKSMRNLTRREIEAMFEQLDAFGWLTRIPGPRPSDPPHWIVNPAVHQKFAERAEAEKKRRERGRDDDARGQLFGGQEMRDVRGIRL